MKCNSIEERFKLANLRYKLYNPKTEYEKEIFPNLGTALVIGGLLEYIGRIGIIVHKAEKDRAGPRTVRIVFPNFWERPDDGPYDDYRDSTHCFDNEWIEITE